MWLILLKLILLLLIVGAFFKILKTKNELLVILLAVTLLLGLFFVWGSFRGESDGTVRGVLRQWRKERAPESRVKKSKISQPATPTESRKLYEGNIFGVMLGS
jgi:hypothetical protein